MSAMQLTANDAKKFAQVWTHRGVVIPLNDVHLQFAADFATVAIRSFLEDAQQKAAARRKAAEAEAAPKIALA